MASETHTIEPGDAIDDRRGDQGEGRDGRIRRIVGDCKAFVAGRIRGSGYARKKHRWRLEREFCGLFGKGAYGQRFAHSTLKSWQSTIRRGGWFREPGGPRHTHKPIGIKAAELFHNLSSQTRLSVNALYDHLAFMAARHEGDPDWYLPKRTTFYRHCRAGYLGDDVKVRAQLGNPIGRAAESMFLGELMQPGATRESAYRAVKQEALKHTGDPDWNWPGRTTVRRRIEFSYV